MAVCAAIVGKDNSPKFFTSVNPEEELMLQYKVLSSLDIVEEKLNSANKSNLNNDLFLGMLYALENYKLYGYVTNTKIKFIIVVDSMNMALRENEIKTIFGSILQNSYCLSEDLSHLSNVQEDLIYNIYIQKNPFRVCRHRKQSILHSWNSNSVQKL